MFTSKAERPQWQLVLDVLELLDVGDLLSYRTLNEIVDGDFKRNRSPLYRAAQEWGRTHRRALAPVPNEGYRVVEAREHEQLARAQHRKSRRALRRSQTVIHNADRTRLSPDERQRFDSLEATLTRHADMIRRLDAAAQRTEMQLAEHAERLDRIEQARRPR